MFAAGKRTRQNFGQLNIAPTDRGLSKSRGKEAALAENRARAPQKQVRRSLLVRQVC
jgi:hypothetical protein